MNIYLMRHATPRWNELGITQGHTHNRLSKTSIELTNKISDDFKNTQIDLIITSPLMRSVQTSNIMNKHHNVKIIKDNRLIDIDQGIFSRTKFANLSEEKKQMRLNRVPEAKLEPYQSVYKRTKNFYLDMINTYKDKNILIITHTINASLLELLINDIEVDYDNPIHLRNFKNAEMKTFKIC